MQLRKVGMSAAAAGSQGRDLERGACCPQQLGLNWGKVLYGVFLHALQVGTGADADADGDADADDSAGRGVGRRADCRETLGCS